MAFQKINHPLKDEINKSYSSVERFAEETGISKRCLYDIFLNKRANVRDDVKVIIANALGLSYEEVWRLVYATRTN